MCLDMGPSRFVGGGTTATPGMVVMVKGGRPLFKTNKIGHMWELFLQTRLHPFVPVHV